MQQRHWRYVRRVLGGMGAGALLLGVSLRAERQTPQQSTSQQPTSPMSGSSTNPMGGSNNEPGIDDPSMARQKHRQEQAGLNERHQHMAADADKLLQMATELKIEIDKSSKNETSVSAYNKADAIERLAHDVKQRLKN